MSQNFKILFLLKQGKGSHAKGRPIYVRVTVDGARAEWSVQRNCEPDKWDQKKGRRIGNGDESKSLNSFLDAVQGKIFDVQKEYTLKNIPITAEIVRQSILHEKKNQYTLISVYQYHNDQFKELVGIQYSPGTYKKFKGALKSLVNFLQWKFKKEDIFLNEVNHQFITDYEFYLKSVQKMQDNSSVGNIKKLKKVIRICLANGWLEKNPFINYRIQLQQTNRNYLLQDDSTLY